jgi:hypothetical protein
MKQNHQQDEVLRCCGIRSERIVRIIAGTVVLTGLALGYWVHEAWYLLTAFAGLNLLQSGFTNFCPPEIVMRWWNKRRQAANSSGCCCSCGENEEDRA